MELAHYIAELLRNHDCVIVPDFGGFIANYKSAVIDHAKNRITPPSKNVLFNPNLVNNDGLLGNNIADKQNISYPNALSFIQGKVSEWQNELENGNRIEIGEIGFLFKQNGQIIFEQSREVNLLLNAYGLSGISFVNFAKPKVEEKEPVKTVLPIEVEAAQETKIIALNASEPIVAVAQEDEKIIPIAKKRRGAWKYIAVAAAIPLLFYAYWIPVETDFIDTGKIQMADFNPINTSPERLYRVREDNFVAKENPTVQLWDDLTADLSDNVTVYNYRFSDELYIPVRLDKTATELPVEEAHLDAPEVNTSSDLIYHVIGGCFSVKSNADNFVNELMIQGYSNAHILDLKGGLYRVSSGDYANRAEAKENLKDFKGSGFSGWILKK